MSRAKRKIKPVVTKTAEELADALGLQTSVAIEWKVRHEVTEEIIRSFEKSSFTVTAFAEKAQTSRARITRILKGDTGDISLDVLFRVLGAAGRDVQLKFHRAS